MVRLGNLGSVLVLSSEDSTSGPWKVIRGIMKSAIGKIEIEGGKSERIVSMKEEIKS